MCSNFTRPSYEVSDTTFSVGFHTVAESARFKALDDEFTNPPLKVNAVIKLQKYHIQKLRMIDIFLQMWNPMLAVSLD